MGGSGTNSEFVEYIRRDFRRVFRDEMVDVKARIMANQESEVWPTSEMVRGKRLKLEAKS